jgi:hypothetical protein
VEKCIDWGDTIPIDIFSDQLGTAFRKGERNNGAHCRVPQLRLAIHEIKIKKPESGLLIGLNQGLNQGLVFKHALAVFMRDSPMRPQAGVAVSVDTCNRSNRRSALRITKSDAAVKLRGIS